MTRQTQVQPRGGCPGHTTPVSGRTAALCLRCARLPIGGEQIAPAWFRINGECDCPNFVAHGCTLPVLPLPVQSADLGGVGNASTRAGVVA